MPQELTPEEICELRALLLKLKSPTAMRRTQKLSLNELAVFSCSTHNVGYQEMLSSCRQRRLFKARVDFAHIAYHYGKYTKSTIARYLGGRHHSTVIHYLNKKPTTNLKDIAQQISW